MRDLLKRALRIYDRYKHKQLKVQAVNTVSSLYLSQAETEMNTMQRLHWHGEHGLHLQAMPRGHDGERMSH